MAHESLILRPATPADVPQILTFIRELADYERLSHQVSATEADLHTHLFGVHPVAEVILAYAGSIPAGFALFFQNFSTFLGKPGLYLEDLYVRPAFQRRGVGRELLLHLVKLAHARGYGRMEWAVLDWNSPAIEFYKSLGAVPMNEWTIFRLKEEALARLAAKS